MDHDDLVCSGDCETSSCDGQVWPCAGLRDVVAQQEIRNLANEMAHAAVCLEDMGVLFCEGLSVA